MNEDFPWIGIAFAFALFGCAAVAADAYKSVHVKNDRIESLELRIDILEKQLEVMEIERRTE